MTYTSCYGFVGSTLVTLYVYLPELTKPFVLYTVIWFLDLPWLCGLLITWFLSVDLDLSASSPKWTLTAFAATSVYFSWQAFCCYRWGQSDLVVSESGMTHRCEFPPLMLIVVTGGSGELTVKGLLVKRSRVQIKSMTMTNKVFF